MLPQVLGGLASNELLKAVSGKGAPENNFIFYALADGDARVEQLGGSLQNTIEDGLLFGLGPQALFVFEWWRHSICEHGKHDNYTNLRLYKHYKCCFVSAIKAIHACDDQMSRHKLATCERYSTTEATILAPPCVQRL